MKYQDPKADLPVKLPVVSRKATIITLLLFLFIALTFLEANVKGIKGADVQKVIQLEDIPITKQKIKEPEPPKPKRAEVIEAEDEEEVDTVTIAETDLVVDSFIPEIIEDDDEIYDFFAVEEQPEVLNQVTPEYPELARRSEMEGQVLVQIVIGKDGKVESAVVVGVRPTQAEGYFEDVSIAAAKKFTFTPAKQRGKPVKVKRNLPFKFGF